MSERDDYRQLPPQQKRALLASLLRERTTPVERVGPLSHGQKALWLLHERAPDSAAYNTAFAVRVRSTVDPDALCTALRTVVDRHAALRTTFGAENGNPVARTSAQGEARFLRVDASGWSDTALEQRVAADYRQPFDLARGPLLRVSLYSRAPADHVLLLTLHHIICDAWSMWMLMHELGVLYPAALAGRPAELYKIEAQYADYVTWQNRVLAGPEGERVWQYWRDQLSGELPILELPTDRPRPATQQLRGASHFFDLDGDIAQRLLEVGKTQGATLFMGLLAVFQTLLYRYSGQDDIIVGSPVVGRNHPDMAATIGYFANPLPLRAGLSGDPTFREFLSQVRHTVLDALTYQDLPFPLLVERLQPKRDPSRWPVFEVMLVLQRPPQSEQFLLLLAGESKGGASWAGLHVEAFPLAQMEGQFDLTWEVVEGRDALACVLKYNPDLFDADTIRRMEGHLRTLIQVVTADPDQRLSKLPLLTVDERQQLLVASEGRETAYPLGRCLHHWIEDQVERSPDAVAVLLADGGGSLSYRELDARANQLARHLRRLGVGPDTIVGVLAERSLELVVGLLGILKAGGAYLPLDPEYPRQRLAFMIADAQVTVLLTHRGLSEDVSGGAPRIVRLDVDWPVVAREERTRAAVEVAADDLAYVIYTSGSTGQPKGAENTHRGICNRLLWMQEEYGLDHTDRVLQKTSFGFDVSVWEFFWPLITGARLVMARPGGHRDRDYLVETIAGRGITTVHFVPSMLQVFLEARGVSRCQVPLRRVFCSGEALSVELQQRLFERLDVDLHNLYGPTEAAVDVTYWRCRRDAGLRTVPIGRPIANTRIYLLDRQRQLVPVGVPGELHIGGVGVARGYRNRPELTAEKFIPDPFSRAAGERLYRTGDLCRWLPDGNLEYLQRIDFQVKVRGFRIELGEIEAALSSHPQVRAALVRVERDGSDARLLAWFVPCRADDVPSVGELRSFARERLPEYMVPAAFVALDALPLTPSGKADRAALPPPAAPVPTALPRTAVEQQIADIWRSVLRLDNPGVDDSFFDVGGHSLLLARVQTGLADAFGRAPSMVDMFQFATIRGLAGFYADAPAAPAAHTAAPDSSADIAIIGLAGRLPGAPDVETFWHNLCGGVESIRFFSDVELAVAGVPPALLADPSYVKAFGALDDIEAFDAGFFGCTPREAELMDVQHRLLLESAWVALENAGHDPQAEERRYGMFAGVGMNRYLLGNLLPQRGLLDSTDAYQLMLGNDKDFAPTRASYKLGLTGPSVSVQTACSTSLVAVHLACRSLLAGECDTALAGGCSVTLPQNRGYRHQEGMILSPDGHCRAFDADARGTIGGSGVGFVVLKRLADALADGDHVHAVIKGSAINNDGAAKAGYTAPGVAGQAAVIGAALAAAGIDPDTVGYVEAHGTGTPLGDPIEIAALTRVFRASTARTGYCALGSVKTNVGHLDSAAGVAGLIKATLAVEYGLVPPSLHFRTPNPALELAESPFRVPSALQSWPANGTPRRAGVSSFGIGGTNAHVVLEQAPVPAPAGSARPVQLLVLSAKQPAALDAATAQLAQHLRQHPQLDLADVAFTLARGRRAFAHRRMLVCRTLEVAIAALDGSAAAGAGREAAVSSSAGEAGACAVAFMFPGQGAQHIGMAAEIYRSEPVFREEIDRCAGLLQPHIGFDLRRLLYPAAADAGTGDERLKQTAIAQPALFVVEYALARLWMSWGVRPEALIGHSLGEYVAACLAGVWTLDDALAVIALRGELMQRQPSGAMLAVSLAESELQRWLRPELALAAVNGPALCVVSGPHAAVDALAGELAPRDVACHPLQTSHAFHSPMMTPAVEPLRARLREIEFRAPTIPFVSNVTGTWIEPAQATDPEYWARHLERTVRFADGLDVLLQEPRRCLIEVGPGNTLASLALRHPRRAGSQAVVASLRHPQERKSDAAQLVEALGKVWVAGGRLDWAAFYAGQRRKRVALPTYAFQRERYWIDAPGADAVGWAGDQRGLGASFQVATWQRTLPPSGAPSAGTHWLLLMDACGVGTAVAARLARCGVRVTRVYPGPGFARRGAAEFLVHPGARADYGRLLDALRATDDLPDVVVHLWNVADDAAPVDDAAARDRSFYSLVWLAQALGDADGPRPCHIAIVSNRLHDVVGDAAPDASKALLLGPVTVIPQEYARLSCASIDLDLALRHCERHVEMLVADAAASGADSPVAYRGGHRWVQVLVPASLPAQAPTPLRPGGVYLITGGTGGVGLALAEWLARGARAAKLVLLARSEAADAADAAARIEQLGAEVLVLRADVASAAQMQHALAAIRARFGALHGVIHAAGIPGGGLIALATREDTEHQFAAKVDGTAVLESLLAGAPLDFFVLCSSVTSILGGAGQVAYTAACAFQDAWAQARAAQGAAGTILSIDWDRWEKVGMAAAAEARFRELTGNDLPAGMHPDEATVAFGRVLAAAPAPRIVVSPRDVAAERVRSRGFQLAQAGERRTALSLHVRPDGAGDYVVPANDTERLIARTWQEELGIDRVGARDDFFALGGDSLTAIRLIARLRQALAVPLDARVLYDAPTVAALGEHVAALRWAAQAGDGSGAVEPEEEGVL